MDLSIIYVNWNSLDYLRESIASVYEHTHDISFEIVVVDNASPERGVDTLKDLFPDVLVTKSSQNLGFAGANNVGFRHSTGEYVLFLNPDTQLIAPSINIMLDHAKARSDAGIVGCKLAELGPVDSVELDPDVSYHLEPGAGRGVPAIAVAALFSVENCAALRGKRDSGPGGRNSGSLYVAEEIGIRTGRNVQRGLLHVRGRPGLELQDQVRGIQELLCQRDGHYSPRRPQQFPSEGQQLGDHHEVPGHGPPLPQNPGRGLRLRLSRCHGRRCHGATGAARLDVSPGQYGVEEGVSQVGSGQVEVSTEVGSWTKRFRYLRQVRSGREDTVCGICGKLNFERGVGVPLALLKSMADTIEHRGPDDEGYYAAGPIGFGFRRLSIIDLNTGHQPIGNEDGTVWIVFNGEIYNYQELRQDLQSRGHIFKTQTDTEVIVHLYEEYGEACAGKLRGMFAFAIWDDKKQQLLLVRDRVGIKPLYYWLTGKSLVFGSEIKAILADPEVRPEVVPGMIDRFLTFYYVPGQETLFRNIYKLAPGSYMVVRGGKAEIKQYWDLQFSPRTRSLEQAEKELLELLEESVRLHMISDVPVGFLLSGGVDSTAMLGFAVGKTDRPLSSYTLGFSTPGLIDERPYAALAAQRYGTEHHETTISSQEFADFLPKFAWYMEEPVCEPQAVALYYVSKLARNYVKVLISGEGGDEAFAGYQTYRGVLWLERLKSLLGPLARPVSAGMSFVNQAAGSKRLAKYAPLLTLPFDRLLLWPDLQPVRLFQFPAPRPIFQRVSRVCGQEYFRGPRTGISEPWPRAQQAGPDALHRHEKHAGG